MPVRFLSLASALVLLAACSSTPEESLSGATGGGAGANGSGIEGSALGGGSPTDITGSELAGAVAPGTQEDFEVNVGDRVFFGFDSTVLDEAGRTTLDRQAAWLQQYPSVTVTIEGHADERGTREYNLALGERRANAAKNYLVALGIDPGRLLTISYGEERPVDPAHDETAWQQNRRAVTVVNLVN